ncbi:GAF domain-containing protein [bacterium]|nr:GAF domain-containing protein [bacterium]
MELETRNTAIPDDIMERWQRVVDALSKLLSVPCVMINRIHPPDLEIFRSNRDSGNPFPAGTLMPMAGVYCEAAAKRKKKVQVSDARKEPAWSDSPTVKAGIVAYLGYPLLWPDGQIFGTLCAVDTRENKWGKKYDSLFHAFKDTLEAHLMLVDTLDQLEKKNRDLEHALNEVKTLRGLLPICSSCKKVRDDRGYWEQIEVYISQHSEAKFSHGICPDCGKKLFPDIKLK